MSDVKLPLTGEAEIDRIHQEEADLLQGVLAQLKEGSDTQIGEAFEAFIAHMDSHFSYEEDLMQGLTGYMMAELHKGEHYKVISDARYRLMQWNQFYDRFDLEDYLIYEFTPWLSQHISSMDIPMASLVQTQERE